MEAELTFRSYKPLKLEKGMWFINRLYPNTKREQVVIKVLDRTPNNDDDAFVMINGYPMEPYIVYENQVLATPQQIAWWDDCDPDSEYFSDITIKQMEDIINIYGGWLDIQMECENDDDECQPTPVIMEGKVVLTYYGQSEEYEEYEEYDEDDEEEEGEYNEDEEEEGDWEYENDDEWQFYNNNKPSNDADSNTEN